jgi:hypothetical protein
MNPKGTVLRNKILIELYSQFKDHHPAQLEEKYTCKTIVQKLKKRALELMDKDHRSYGYAYRNIKSALSLLLPLDPR